MNTFRGEFVDFFLVQGPIVDANVPHLSRKVIGLPETYTKWFVSRNVIVGWIE